MDMVGWRLTKRTYDFGISEQDAATFVAGIEVARLKPFCCIYSPLCTARTTRCGWVVVFPAREPTCCMRRTNRERRREGGEGGGREGGRGAGRDGEKESKGLEGHGTEVRNVG